MSSQQQLSQQSQKYGSNQQSRPQSVGRKHNIVHKDYFRAMKNEKVVKQHLEQTKKSPSRMIRNQSSQKYKTKSQLIIESYEKPNIPEEKIYMIDKVVRLRGKQGRFGLDHSEIMNFEIELANKQRADHMNLLVYKSIIPSSQGTHRQQNNEWNKENNTYYGGGADDGGDFGLTSEVLFKRLTQKELDLERKEQKKYKQEIGGDDEQQSTSQSSFNKSGMSFQEWLRKKDAETRLKKKLVNEVKTEIRQDLLELAKQEQSNLEQRMKNMEDWLMQKRMTEASKYAKLRELEEKEEIARQMREEYNYTTYKNWLKSQMIKERNQKQSVMREKSKIMDQHQEDQMKKSIDGKIDLKQWQKEQNQGKNYQIQQQQHHLRLKEQQDLSGRQEQEESQLDDDAAAQLSSPSQVHYSPLRVRDKY